MALTKWGDVPAKYNAQDWKRLPGKSNQFQNAQDPSLIISRRTHMRLYGTHRYKDWFERGFRHLTELEPYRKRLSPTTQVWVIGYGIPKGYNQVKGYYTIQRVVFNQDVTSKEIADRDTAMFAPTIRYVLRWK